MVAPKLDPLDLQGLGGWDVPVTWEPLHSLAQLGVQESGCLVARTAFRGLGVLDFRAGLGFRATGEKTQARQQISQGQRVQRLRLTELVVQWRACSPSGSWQL